ncbi:MAG TPA: PfkB family carbohydrate kinase [Solirubrobacteraceae bacterium]|nr:PfkB family carbohydrate kinase [Solirubrobacteraceae bacterium]
MPRLAVVGHVEWVDFIPIERFPRRGEVVHGEGSFARAAGGGGVVAVVLAELFGAEVDFYTALGDDASGRAAVEQLTARGVSVHAAWRADQPTRRALTLLEATGERTIITAGERLEPRGEDDLDWERLAQTDGVYFTAGDAAALQNARQATTLVASPRGRAALADGPMLDALVFSHSDPDESQWARQLEPKARVVVETRGAAGGVWWGEETGSWEAVAPGGPARDAYGCGDSFAAGFTFGLAAGRSLAEAAALGAHAGARMLTRRGAP